MFQRADLLYEMGMKRKLHVLSFEWEEFRPSLYIYDPKRLENKELDLWRLGFKVGPEIFCTGSFTDGKYVPCPERKRVSRFSQCQRCASSFIADQECIFEPKCSGEKCDLEFCKREHSVYIVFFHTTAKVGMSSSSRVRQRAIEQGADAFSIVRCGSNRKEGREIESGLSETLKLRQHLRREEIVGVLGKRVDKEKIEVEFGMIAEKMESLGLKPSKLEFLDRYPIQPTLPKTPRLTPTSGTHMGKVLGIKGRFLVYECENELYALNIQDVVGRYVSI